jgi:O-phospho-L-seryl-tRNASec:L-selenocysteinyl-tRNA synthase
VRRVWRAARRRRARLEAAAAQLGERVLVTPSNPISLAMTLDGLAAAAARAKAGGDGGGGAGGEERGGKQQPQPDVTFFGAMLWTRCLCVCVGAVHALLQVPACTAAPCPRPLHCPPRCSCTRRNVSGTRVLVPGAGKRTVIAGLPFDDYGCHASGYPHPYMNAAAALGCTKDEVDVFVERLVKAYRELLAKWAAGGGGGGGGGGA